MLLTPPTLSLSRFVLQRVNEIAPSQGTRGPLAIVANSSTIGVSEAYARLSQEQGRAVQVFWSAEEANAWLDERARRRGTADSEHGDAG